MNKNNSDEAKLDATDHRALLEVFSRIGRVEGRVDGLENRITAWEEKIEGRLSTIEERLEQLFTKLSEGKGLWRAVQALAWIIVAIPSFIIIYQVFSQ